MRSERLSSERFPAIDKYSPEGADWAWESADTRRVYTIAGLNRVREISARQLFVAIDLLLKGFAGARNQHYLQLWRPAV